MDASYRRLTYEEHHGQAIADMDASNSRGVSNRKDAGNSRHTVESIMAVSEYNSSIQTSLKNHKWAT
jgi:hypothetical protein